MSWRSGAHQVAQTNKKRRIRIAFVSGFGRILACFGNFRDILGKSGRELENLLDS